MALTDTDSEKPSTGFDEQLELTGRLQTYYDNAVAAMSRRHELWRRSHLLVHNRAPASKDAHVPPVSASEVFPILAALVGWMTDQPTKFGATAVGGPHGAYAEWVAKLAQDLEKQMWAVWKNHSYDAEIERMLWDAMIYGTGFLKTIWDPSADDGAGNVRVVRTDPFVLLVDPNATSIDDPTCTYICEARDMPLQELERRFPKKYAEVLERGRGGFEGLQPRRDDALGGASKTPMANPGALEGGRPVYGLPGQTQPRMSDGDWQDGSVTVLEFWIKENVLYHPPSNDEADPSEDAPEESEPYLVPEWRVIVTCGPVILMDEMAKDLWGHGGHPYDRYVMHDLGEMWGISLVDHLAPCQLAVNRLLAALQHHSELVGNPVLLEDANSGINRTLIVNKAGQRVTKNAGSDVGWLNPPPMEPGVKDLVTFWINEMERISGLSAIVRGATPTGRNAQGVIDSVQESAFVRVRLALRNLERLLCSVGDKVANLIVENYTTPRTTAIIGPDGEQSQLALRGRHWFAPTELGADPMRFAIEVTAGANHPISRSARIQEADTLFAMGAIDAQAVLEAHDYPDRRNIAERVNAQMQMGMEVGGGGKRKRQR